jgi:hypothetical protein
MASHNLVGGDVVMESDVVKIGAQFSAIANGYFNSSGFRNPNGIDLLHKVPDACLEFRRRVLPWVEGDKHRAVRRVDRVDSGNWLGFQKCDKASDIKMMPTGNSRPECNKKRTVAGKLETRVPKFFGEHGGRLTNFDG